MLIDILTHIRDRPGDARRPILLCVPAQYTKSAQQFDNAMLVCQWLLVQFPQACVRNLQIRDIDGIRANNVDN